MITKDKNDINKFADFCLEAFFNEQFFDGAVNVEEKNIEENPITSGSWLDIKNQPKINTSVE
jgi:hypothetical protein